jgi:hypothetical protein
MRGIGSAAAPIPSASVLGHRLSLPVSSAPEFKVNSTGSDSVESWFFAGFLGTAAASNHGVADRRLTRGRGDRGELPGRRGRIARDSVMNPKATADKVESE